MLVRRDVRRAQRREHDRAGTTERIRPRRVPPGEPHGVRRERVRSVGVPRIHGQRPLLGGRDRPRNPESVQELRDRFGPPVFAFARGELLAGSGRVSRAGEPRGHLGHAPQQVPVAHVRRDGRERRVRRQSRSTAFAASGFRRTAVRLDGVLLQRPRPVHRDSVQRVSRPERHHHRGGVGETRWSGLRDAADRGAGRHGMGRAPDVRGRRRVWQ